MSSSGNVAQGIVKLFTQSMPGLRLLLEEVEMELAVREKAGMENIPLMHQQMSSSSQELRLKNTQIPVYQKQLDFFLL